MPADTLKKPGRLRRFLDSDIGWSFCHTPVAWLSALGFRRWCWRCWC